MKRILSILALAALFTGVASAQEIANIGKSAGLVSPEVGTDGIIFRLDANYATTVGLKGNWMDPASEPLQMKKEGGIWSITIPKLEPEIYTYNFVVDGVSLNDPLNPFIQRDGSRYLNMLFVDGPRSENYNECEQRGNLTTLWYDSPSLGINRRMIVYTPYGYNSPANKRVKYPVLYLLHGGGGDEEAWTSMGRAAQIMDNLIQKGLAKPMIVVMPNGNSNQQAASILGLPTTDLDPRAPENANAYVKSLVTEIVPFIEKNYRVIAKPASRAIAGLSMGGGHTLAASALYPGKFAYICPLSIGTTQSAELDKQLKAVKKGGYKLYWLACGTSDFLYDRAKELDAALTKNGLTHTFFVSDGGHEWKNWRLYLNTFAPLLFK
ncbi:MAG: alpha/beta hydrolase-fold protein [Bacteroidales bacterium]|nr:alpha/beta hydrolase-fold protein [Bacteroidales bacterium]